MKCDYCWVLEATIALFTSEGNKPYGEADPVHGGAEKKILAPYDIVDCSINHPSSLP